MHPGARLLHVTDFTARERWIMLAASAWLVTGLQLDAYAHATTPNLETFWTPWHAVLYSGIAASGFTLVWLLRSRLPVIPTYRTLFALPNALRIPMLGMAFLLVGGGADTLWHNIFGIEKGLEIFVSPSHEFIILGMVLVAMGPALMTATVPGGRLTIANSVLVMISALLSALPLHIYSLHASVFGTMYFGGQTEDFGGRQGDEIPIFGRDAQVMHGYLFGTVLLLLPILLIGRRWRLPLGLPTVLVAAPAVAMHLMFFLGHPWWTTLTVAAAAAGTEVLLRVLARFVPAPREVAWLLLGLAAPPLVWGALLLAADVHGAVGWTVHIVTGLLTLTALTGGATVLVTRNINVVRAGTTEPAEPDRAGVLAP
jgi:hypothetical protein